MISAFPSTGIDYIPPPATFTLDSNMPRQCINVTLASDIFVDGQEFFMSQITTNLPAQQVTIGGPAQVIITDGNSKEIMSIIIIKHLVILLI